MVSTIHPEPEEHQFEYHEVDCGEIEVGRLSMSQTFHGCVLTLNCSGVTERPTLTMEGQE